MTITEINNLTSTNIQSINYDTDTGKSDFGNYARVISEYRKPNGTFGYKIKYNISNGVKVYTLENGTLTEYDFKPTIQENIEFINNTLNIDLAKQQKQNELNIWYKAQISNGFLFQGNIFILSQEKANDISQLKTATDFNLANGETELQQILKISNIAKQQISFTYSDFINFGSLYGKKLTSIIFDYKNKRNAIDKVNDLTELNNITI